MTLTTAPAIIIRQLLLDNDLASIENKDDPKPFPIKVSHEPDQPDDIITVYDQPGSDDGRFMQTGERVQHEGVQVRVRSKVYLTGYARLKSIADFFDTILREEIIVDSINYLIQNISRTAPILPLGVEKRGTQQRELFTLNILVTINEEI